MHTYFTELMSLALDHEADVEQLRALKTHLEICPACAATWARWQALDVRFRAAPMLAPPPDLAARVMARLAAHDSRRRSWGGWLGLLVAWGAIACTGLLTLIACAWWGIMYPVQASMALAAIAQLLGALVWPLRGLEIVLDSAGLSLQATVAGCLGLTAALIGLWIWRVAHLDAAGRIRAMDRHADRISGGV